MTNAVPMKLGDKQRLFAYLIAKLIVWCYKNDYEVSFGEATRDPRIAVLNSKAGKGISNSLHLKRLAIDLNLFVDKSLESDEDFYAVDSEAHRPIGEYWKTLHPLCRWGGDFAKPDGNHYSMEHGGVK